MLHIPHSGYMAVNILKLYVGLLFCVPYLCLCANAAIAILVIIRISMCEMS